MSGSDPPPTAQWEEAHRWFAKAAEDLQVAKLAMQATPQLVGPAAYDCQQAAEKLFKGLLVRVAVDVPRTHDLERLAVLLLPHYPLLADDIEPLAMLTPWGVLTRYPQLESDFGLGGDDVDEAIRTLVAFSVTVTALAPRQDGPSA